MPTRPHMQRARRSSTAAIPCALAIAMVLAAATTHAQSVPADTTFAGVSRAAADSAARADSLARLRDIGDLLTRIIRRPMTEKVIEPRPGLSMTILPSVGYNPSYGAFFGASVSLGGWLGDPKTTGLSAGSLGASYSTTKQISVQFKSDFYLPDNTWALKGDWRYLDTSQPTFGLGPSSPDRAEYPMSFVLYRLYQSLYRRVGPSPIFVGLGYLFDRYDDIRDARADSGQVTPYTLYSGGAPTRSQSSGISLNILIDTRDNAINAARGSYWNASLRAYGRALGGDENRQSMWSDFRSFSRLPRDSHNVLAVWSFLWMTFGHAPYLELPAIGWDTYGRSGRGFLQGNIRGGNMAYVEFEYRMRFTRDDMWGAVGFLNLTSVTATEGGAFGAFDPGYGAGIRVKFNKRTNTNLSVDAALGQDSTWRFFFGLQEVF
jgi:outer membrane protein assembly factor BamA